MQMHEGHKVVACTCNPATLETEFRNGVGSMSVGGVTVLQLVGRLCVTLCDPAQGQDPD